MFCPSRGRPQEAHQVLKSFQSTVSNKDGRLVFLVDNDDPTQYDYPNGWVALRNPTGDPTGPLNYWAMRSASPVLGFMGDDSRFETPGWDLKVIDALSTPGFAWGMDGTSNRPWPSTCFISREIVRALKYMVPPTLRRGFFDVAWVQLANATNTTRVIDAMFRHDNSPGDPSSPNFIPERRVPPEVIKSDEAAFNEWLGRDYRTDVRAIRHTLYA